MLARIHELPPEVLRGQIEVYLNDLLDRRA